MKKPTAVLPRECELGPEPLLFIGPPGRLLGRVELRNRSGEPLKIKHLAVHGIDLEIAPGSPFVALPIYAKLLPNEQRKTPASFQVNPQSAPGIYEGEIEAARGRRPFKVQVLENWELHCAPLAFSLKVASGATVVRTIQLTNAGNMPWTLGRSVFAILKEKNGLHHAIHRAIRNSATNGAQPVLDEFVREFGAREIEPLVVKCTAAARALAPGESRAVELEMTMPQALRRHRAYVGSIEFENARLRLEIEIVNPEGN